MLRVAVGATWETAFRRRFLLDSRYAWDFGVPAAAAGGWSLQPDLFVALFDLSARDERNPLWWWWRGLRSGHQCCGPSLHFHAHSGSVRALRPVLFPVWLHRWHCQSVQTVIPGQIFVKSGWALVPFTRLTAQ